LRSLQSNSLNDSAKKQLQDAAEGKRVQLLL